MKRIIWLFLILGTFFLVSIVMGEPSFSSITDNSTATAPTNSTDVQINITITDATNVDFYTLSHNDTRWCYQETANVSTSCGGLDTGVYGFTGEWNGTKELYDGDWNTYNISSDWAFFYINYTKPANALNSSIWRMKYNWYDWTWNIPEVCWNYLPTKLIFKIVSFGDADLNWIYCGNGVDSWQEIDADSGDNKIYEEAMWWDIPNHWTNETIIDVEAATVNVIWNYTIENFPTTGGVLGIRFWSNNTGGYANVSIEHTITIQPVAVDTCTPTAGQTWTIEHNCTKSAFSFSNPNYPVNIKDGSLTLKDYSNMTSKYINISVNPTTRGYPALNISPNSKYNRTGNP